MARQLGVTWTEAAGVVLSTLGIYLTVVLFVRVVGQRSLASMASFDFGAAVAIGAVLGRTALLERPTLLAGVLVLATLFTLQGALGMLRQNRRADRLLNREPVLLAAGSRLLMDNMRRAHVVEDELRQKLRLAGVRRLDEVACVVLERNGAVSVLRRDAAIDPWLLADVAGHELVPLQGERSGGPDR